MLNLLLWIKPWFLRQECFIYSSFICSPIHSFIYSSKQIEHVNICWFPRHCEYLNSFSKSLSLLGQWDVKSNFHLRIQYQKKSCDYFRFPWTSSLLGLSNSGGFFFFPLVQNFFKTSLVYCPSSLPLLSSIAYALYIFFIALSTLEHSVCLLPCCLLWLLLISLCKNFSHPRTSISVCFVYWYILSIEHSWNVTGAP